MPQPDWIEAPAAWNTPVLGPVTLPGVWRVTTQKGRDVDFKKSPEQDGGTDTDKGSTPAKVTLQGTLNASHWALWQQVAPQIDPNRPGAAAAPLEIRHPGPNARGIRNVRVLDISVGAPTAKGGISITIQCREWFPAPKPAKTKPKKDIIQSLLNDQPTRYTSFLYGREGGLELQSPEDAESVFQNLFGSAPPDPE